VNRGTARIIRSTATGLKKSPAECKFSGARHKSWSATLDVTSMAFDPVRGPIVLVGAKQQAAQTSISTFLLTCWGWPWKKYEPFFA